jgi:hypothetical protein
MIGVSKPMGLFALALRSGIILPTLLTAACTTNGSTTVSTTTTDYDGSYSGKAAGLDNCTGAVAYFTVKDGQIVGGESNDYELSHRNFAGSVNTDGTAIVFTMTQHYAVTRKRLDIAIKGDTFEMRGDLNCGEAIFEGRRRTTLALR